MDLKLKFGLTLVVFALCSFAEVFAQIPYAHPMAATKKGIVVTCQPLAAQLGVEVLRKGGNAADAFVATTLGEYVTAYGYTSLSGPLNLLYYDAQTKHSYYLNAGFNSVNDPAGKFDPSNPVAGKSFAIGGAGAGLDALNRRFGRWPFHQVVQPAADLARKGFPLIPIFAWTIQNRMPLFTKSAEWNTIFAPGGKAFTAGQTLMQTQLADTLTQFGKLGSDYLFKGKFASDLVQLIQANGGKLTLQDLANYKVNWAEPLSANYRGFEVKTGSYRSAGGLLLLSALKTIEHDTQLADTHFTQDKQKFETVLRTFLFSLQQGIDTYFSFDQRIDSLKDQQAFINGAVPDQIWASVTNPNLPAPWSKAPGHDSCDTLVIDRDGNIVASNHTIFSLQWGDYGLMNDGVSLNSAANQIAYGAAPGERALDPLMPVLIFQNNKPWAAAGFFDGSLQAAGLEVLLNLMDYRMNPSDAIYTPRFGTPLGANPVAIPLDPRLPASWAPDFAKKGIALQQPKNPDGSIKMHAYVDTGDAMVIRIDSETGMHYGSPSEVLMEAVAAEE